MIGSNLSLALRTRFRVWLADVFTFLSGRPELCHVRARVRIHVFRRRLYGKSRLVLADHSNRVYRVSVWLGRGGRIGLKIDDLGQTVSFSPATLLEHAGEKGQQPCGPLGSEWTFSCVDVPT